MILEENVTAPTNFRFDVAIAAIGYERRCRFVIDKHDVSATHAIGLEFGFLQSESYAENRRFFDNRDWDVFSVQQATAFDTITKAIIETATDGAPCRVFLDISAMSREMMASVTLAIRDAQKAVRVAITVAYAPAEFGQSYDSAPIRVSAPVKPELAGWSSRPDRPLGVIMGLGCEPGLALGALQVLEPHKAWVHTPKGFDERFSNALNSANVHISDIFDITKFDYEISEPYITRAKVESLLNSVAGSFRVICIPFGPKIFAWLLLSTVIFQERHEVGVWAFSSREQAEPVDRAASGQIVWHTALLGAPHTDEVTS